jgi:hypothetical protein
VGQEEGRGTQIACAHSHSGQRALSELKQNAIRNVVHYLR